ncbi:DNA repair protein RecO [Lactobacillus psittaci]|uniref:DNA repair protein RecO n=1 Tax=Lactobacillus psittaci DSM 15354 TaxID=1122152 RepID=A0A0R1SBD2_9LACO|nr:DNA repair protein RecO [Lactobacillus psittaci]KRL63653.1 DNA repair protein RecO [Lactobacillus psittaci DSM 15354]
MAKEVVEITGIVFKRQRYKEADVLAKIISKDMGIFTMLVRGALRPKSKLSASVLAFSFGKYQVLTSQKGLSTLKTYKDVKQFTNLYSDLTLNSYACYLCDLFDHAFIEYQDIGPYYNLIETALTKIDQGIDPEVICQLVELQMLKAFGVKPELKKCAICGTTEGSFDYSISTGGIICQKHFNQVTRLHLTSKQVALLRTLGLIQLQRLGNIAVSSSSKAALRKAIDRIYIQTVDLNLKTKKFLEEMRRLKI